jgi:TRAP-type C4-dicarboxylate transport system permease small subunit
LSSPRSSLVDRAEAIGRLVENVLLAVLLTGLIGLASYQILLRNVFAAGLPWADGLVRLAVLWLAAIGAVAATRDRRHIEINLIARALPDALRRLVAAGVNGFAAGVTGFLAWQSGRFVADSRAFEDTLLGDWPAWHFQLVLPVAFALMAWRFALACVSALRGRGV